MKKVLLDTNIVLDILLKRVDFYKDAVEIIKISEKNYIKGCLTATTITDIYYVIKKQYGIEESLKILSNFINYIEILKVTEISIKNALISNIKDFEDAIQVEIAKENNIELIITRNYKDFKNSDIKVLTPKEFLYSLN